MGARSSGLHLEVARIQSEINRLFEHLLGLRDGATVPGAGGGWVPPVDVAEAGDVLIVEAELPGVDAATLEVFAQEGNLVLRGRRDPCPLRETEDARVLHDERETGPFERAVSLGVPVNPHKAEAVFASGVLTIRLPRVPNRRGAAVPIAVTATVEETR